jgi:putative membrane protein
MGFASNMEKKIMKKTILLFSSAAILLGAACKKSSNHGSHNPPLSDQDQQFLIKASYSNLAEVDAGTLASTKGANAGIKMFGEMMVEDHTTAENELKMIADSNQVSVPGAPDSAHQAMKAKLMALSGNAFDTTYIGGQVIDHQTTVTLFQTEISSGQSERVIAYANKYLPKIQMHLVMADSLNLVVKMP